MIDRLRDPGREVPGCKFLCLFSLRPATSLSPTLRFRSLFRSLFLALRLFTLPLYLVTLRIHCRPSEAKYVRLFIGFKSPRIKVT